MKHPADKVITLEAAVEWRGRLRRDGGTLAVTNGCFDLLHRTHVEFLWRARRLADGLLVLLNSDASVWQLKGDGRPVLPQDERAFLLAALPCVAAVVIFDGPRCAEELEALAPEVYAKSAEYAQTQDRGEAEALRRIGAQTIFLAPEPGLTTTAIIARAYAAESARLNRPAEPFGHPGRDGAERGAPAARQDTDGRGCAVSAPPNPRERVQSTRSQGAAAPSAAAPGETGSLTPSGGCGGRAASATRGGVHASDACVEGAA